MQFIFYDVKTELTVPASRLLESIGQRAMRTVVFASNYFDGNTMQLLEVELSALDNVATQSSNSSDTR